ncbi:transferrin-binding protein-like solute binding protein [Alteriqipengyuania sp. WL0013]|uniref:transferrin-binding protein-like solute binding protein n=1 Tax=Alteriqipengyuania sp. WL0013 TaxID=3110773 RepID=UPI002BF40C10|nr:transferrin-binding protein-like solute binding protein [Alteriqipengyuania sp. WL0013]MEB3414621.1 transferrin-binding protein-like solute binding protein [Alteriqipengyuania sp. WL0013]
MNNTLDGELQSESFANLASRATLEANGSAGNGTIQEGVVAQIVYNADSKSYTLTTPSGTRTFAESDIDASLSNGSVTVYVQTSGDTTNSLTLTRADAGGVNFTYVGSAFWQQTTQNSTSGSGAVDSIIYGVKTPDNGVPTTGQGSYALTAYGAMTTGPNIFPIGGTGEARIDFESGKIFLIGEMIITDGDPGRDLMTFSGDGALASDGNRFSGSFTLTDFQTYEGSFAGMFFGPAAEEIGATWAAQDSVGNVATGTLMGRAGAASANDSFRPDDGGPRLENSELFVVQDVAVRFDAAQAPGQSNSTESISSVAIDEGQLSIFFDAVTNTYQLSRAGGPEDRFDAFGNSILGMPMGFSNWELLTGRTYVASSAWRYSNPEIDPDYLYSYAVFGFPTANADTPRTGEAAYGLTFDGRVVDPDYANPFLIQGTGALRASFVSGALDLSGSLRFGEDYFLSGRAGDSFTGVLSGTGSISSTANSFSGTFDFGGIGNYSGDFSGMFYGPAAEEVGGTFAARDENGAATGTFTGVQDDTITDSSRTLAGATEPTDLTGYSIYSGIYVDLVEVTYDPATGGYAFTIDPSASEPMKFAFDDGDIDVASSTSSRNFYETGGNPGASGFIAVLGESNPEIQLSYLTFGRVAPRDDTGTLREYFTVFGLETPSSTLPRAGNATYSGIVVAEGTNANTGYTGTVSGISEIAADFGAGTMTLWLSLVQDDAGSTAIGDFLFNGQIANNGFGGSVDSDASNGAIGQMRGAFFGADANEYGAVFDVLNDEAAGRSKYSGVAVGKKD